MSRDEEFPHRYDEWAAGKTADIDFYVRLELEALDDGFAGEPFDDAGSEYVFVCRR